MDSGNSGSMHSSSAGDQEFDSTLLQKPTKTSLSSSSLFNPFSHSYNNNQELLRPSFQNTLQAPGPGPEPAMRPEQPVKNSRKRTRASRRAPTTILTTDTSNFRQMVQEFTGIPAPPFSAAATSSSAYSRRLDLFSNGALGQFYPFRPSAQKVPTVTTDNGNVISNDIFSSSYNQLLSNNSNLGYNDNLQSQLLSSQPFVFGTSKSQGNLVGEMGITQEHINANISSFLGEGKVRGRENNGGGVQDNNAISTRNEEGGLNSWNYSADFSR